MCVFISVAGLTGFDFPEYSLLTGRYTSALMTHYSNMLLGKNRKNYW